MTNYKRLILLLLLLVTYYTHVSAQQSTAAAQLDEVAKVFETLSQSNAYTEDLTSASCNVLPIGIKRTMNNMEITIAVDKVVFHPDYAELSVLARAIIPQKNLDLFFGGRGIKLSYEGSIIGDANLTLLGDIEIPFNNGNMSLVLKGDYSFATGSTKSKTYMAIDCKGCKELGLNAELRFPESLMVKVQDDGTIIPTDRKVCCDFSTVIQDWSDIIADISLPSFQVVGLNGFIFNIEHVVFDFSDTRNDDDVRFPAGYEGKYMIPGAATLWRGVYARAIEVTLPKAFNDINDKPVRFSAQNLLIDDNGITGAFSAENILSFETGNASGWNFSVDRFGLELEANKLIAAGFGGQIGLPFEGGKTKLDYDAFIMENNEYLMSVSTVDSLDFSIFSAKATILPNSYLKLHMIDGRFRPEALLHGSMSIDVDAAKVPSLDFRSLCLKTESPYISVEYLGYKGKVSLGAFPVSLNDISLKCPPNGKVELSSGVEIALAQDLFAGSTNLTFLASQYNVGGRQKWRCDGVRIGAIGLDASIAGALKLKGQLEWRRDDPVYGNGMFGELAVTINALGDLRVDMRGCFGAVDDYRYWFVDGGTKFPVAIPIVGPLRLKGLSGAVSQKMVGSGRQQNGGTFSTAVYTPDKNMGLGLKAAILFDVASVADGEACFDIAFTSKGGLAYIGFYGYAKFAGKLGIDVSSLTDKYADILQKEQEYISNSNSKVLAKLDNLKQFEPNKAAEIVSPLPTDMTVGLMGSVGIQYDFRNSSFHASTELYFNTPGGFLTGIDEGGRAGWGVIHIDPSEWYMHLGSPSNRVGIKLNLGNILNLRLGSYFMAGSRIPDMPAPPQELANILGQDLSRLTLGRNLEGLSTGRGFAFGSDFQIRTGDITFLMMYANFMAGLGFDIMFKDYGDLQCAQTGRQVGLNGWYAMGQTYAYLQGELGVKINLWFLKMKFPIIKGSAATLMQAMLPNPSSFKGYLGVNINLLGLIKGNMRFKLSLGEECDPVIPGGSPLKMAMISDLAPSDGDSQVSVFSMPQATFNMSIGTSFTAEDDKGTHTYRIQLRSFTVRDDKGEAIEGTLKWNSSKDAVSFQSKEILPPNAPLTAEVKVTFDKFENGAWKTVFTSGVEAVETKTCVFETGGAPNNIPLQNIMWSYPVIDQSYFLTDESRGGFTQLQFGQKYLFERGFDYNMVFTAADGSEITTDFRYNEQDNRLEYTVPELMKQRQYTLSLSYTPEGVAAVNDRQVSQVVDSEEEGTLTVDNRTASADVNTSIRESILDYGFSTSRYATFADKIGAIDTADENSVAEDAGLSYRFLYKVRADEAFDEAEVSGVEKSGWKALIQPAAELGEPFFVETVIPLVYIGYPYGTVRLQYRDDQVAGVPPVRSVFAYEPYLNLIADGNRPTSFYFPFAYEASVVAERDFRDLQSSVVNNRQSVPSSVYQRFATGSLPFVKYGKYKVIMKYVLPDGTVTSSYEFYFYNHLQFNK